MRILMEHLEAGDRIDDLLDDYPTVARGQAGSSFAEKLMGMKTDPENGVRKYARPAIRRKEDEDERGQRVG